MSTSALSPRLLSENTPLTNRVQSVDLLRGAVMILMAIDHVRVYSGIPAGGTTPGVFFTRWVTHFCVPAFVFFAGTSAFLYGQKINDSRALARFLLTRGALLVLFELTLIRFFWTFNFDYAQFTLAGVIWMLGWCMILTALVIRLPIRVIWITGLGVAFGQQVFGLLPQVLPSGWRGGFGRFWEFFYPSGLDPLPGIHILYVLIPWIGVMMAGYGFGLILTGDSTYRKKFCLSVGLSAIAVFLVLGSWAIWNGQPDPKQLPFLFRLLNQQKYPASQLYLLMTLGPLIALVPFAERASSWFADALITFGRVPMFYYLLHIPLIHLAALGVNYFQEGNFHQDRYGTAPFTQFPEASRWDLSTLYLVFGLVEIILYFACRWYALFKAARPELKWTKYI